MSKDVIGQAMLEAWADWIVRQENGAHSLPRSACFGRVRVNGGNSGSVTLGDVQAVSMSEALSQLSQSGNQGRMAFSVIYLNLVGDYALPPAARKPLSMQDCASKLGCALSTAYAYRRVAMQAIKQDRVLHIRKNR